MRLNKKMKGSFAGPLCGVVALGIVGLGISCPYLDGAYAADESSLQNLASTCIIDGSDSNTAITIDEAGNLSTGGVIIGRVADEENVVSLEEGSILDDGNVRYELPQLICRSAVDKDVVFYFDMDLANFEATTLSQAETDAQVAPVMTARLARTGDVSEVEAFDQARFNVVVVGPAEAQDLLSFLAIVRDYVQITRPEAGTNLDNINIEINPGNFGSNYADFDVLANRGFEIHVTADDVNLTGTEGNEAEIAPIASPVSAVNINTGFGDNTWGYSINKVSSTGTATVETYRPITSTIGEAALIVDGGASTGENTYRFTCGTKVGTTLPADEYSTTVTISAVIPAAAAANL